MPDEVLIAGGGIAVAFRRAGDRFAHAIGWLEGGVFVPALESVEGTPNDLWPASPPLQSLHCEDRPDGKRLALLVGMSGRSHWSLSVEVDPAKSTITFDVACRLHDEPEELTSTYRTACEVAETPQGVQLRHSSRGRLELCTDSTAEQTGARGADRARLLRIRCSMQSQLLPRTARWKYMVRRPS